MLNGMVTSRYLQASQRDLQTYGDQCAICRETMKEATKLPCGHCFHLSCLHSWIHHRTSQATCPSCRSPIGSSPASDDTSPEIAVTYVYWWQSRSMNDYIDSFYHNRSSIWGGKYLLSLLPWNIEVSLTARNSQYDDTSSSVYSVYDRDDNVGTSSGTTTPYRAASFTELTSLS